MATSAMPTYEFRCGGCGLFRLSAPLTGIPGVHSCPHCGKEGRRVFSSQGLLRRGSVSLPTSLPPDTPSQASGSDRGLVIDNVHVHGSKRAGVVARNVPRLEIINSCLSDNEGGNIVVSDAGAVTIEGNKLA